MNKKQKEIKKEFYIKCKDYTEIEYEVMIKKEENQDEIDGDNWKNEGSKRVNIMGRTIFIFLM